MSVTESSSSYDNLEKMSVHELLVNMNREDKTVPLAIEKIIPDIERLVKAIVEKMAAGGRLFYIGAGTAVDWEFWMPPKFPRPTVCHMERSSA
jgi:N-acetylmuramic acid 6-phosphate etherase